MTIYRRLNVNGQGGNHTTWWLIKTMLDAGWTVPASGSGSSGLYDSSNVFDLAQTPKNGDILDPNGVGIGSEPWGHPSCWILMEDPAGDRQYTFQRSASSGWANDGAWTFIYSPSGLFGVGETPGIDWDEVIAATASDGTTLTPAGDLFHNNLTLTHVAADDVPSPAGEYGVICLEFYATNNLHGMFLVDDLRNASPGHPHAVVNWCLNVANGLTLEKYHGTSGADSPGGVNNFGGNLQSYYDNAPHCRWYGGGVECLPSNGGTGGDGKERAAPVFAGFIGREGYIGTSRWIRDPSVSRGYPNTGTSLQYLFVNDLLIVDLWDGVTSPGTI